MTAYVIWSNPLALLSHKIFKTTWGRNEVSVAKEPYPNRHPLVPTLYKVDINGVEYLLDGFGREFVMDAIHDNNTSMNELINRAETYDKRWMLTWSV